MEGLIQNNCNKNKPNFKILYTWSNHESIDWLISSGVMRTSSDSHAMIALCLGFCWSAQDLQWASAYACVHIRSLSLLWWVTRLYFVCMQCVSLLCACMCMLIWCNNEIHRILSCLYFTSHNETHKSKQKDPEKWMLWSYSTLSAYLNHVRSLKKK